MTKQTIFKTAVFFSLWAPISAEAKSYLEGNQLVVQKAARVKADTTDTGIKYGPTGKTVWAVVNKKGETKYFTAEISKKTGKPYRRYFSGETAEVIDARYKK